MAEQQEIIVTTLQSLLEAKKYNSLKDMISTMNPADIAAVLEEFQQSRLLLLFRLLPKDLAAESFVEMDPAVQEEIIRGFSDKELKEIVDELYMDDAVDLIEEMPSSIVKRILTQADAETRRAINDMLKYPEDSAGSMMTTEFVDLVPEMTADEAMSHIREAGIDSETINVCYVVGKKRELIGVVTLRSLVLAKNNPPISELMDEHVISVSTVDDQEEVAQVFAKYNFIALPVVDKEQRLVGIVTVDDAIDVMQEEATEDIAKMAAIVPVDKPYLRRSTFELWKSRIPWLMLLMVSATFTGIILNTFEDALAACIALTSFIPMLMDTAGNSGSQASVTIIRALSLGDVEFKNLGKVIWKEIRVAVICAATLAVVNFVKILLVDKMLLGNNEITIMIDFVVCATLFVTICLAKLVGCSLPMFADKLGFDPAVMASPFITTIVDALSLLVYFLIAQTLLPI